MTRTLHYGVILLSFATCFITNQAALPPCPPNFQFFPHTYPLNCKPSSPTILHPSYTPHLPPYYSPDKLDDLSGKPPGFPQLPLGMPPMPGSMPMPGMPGMPGMMANMAMPAIYSSGAAYNEHRKHSKKSRPYKRKIKFVKRPHHHRHTSDSSSESDSCSHDSDSNESHKNYRRNARFVRHNKMSPSKEYLKPILQYVSKDGYVIFEKEISKGEANDWMGKDPRDAVHIKLETHKETQKYRASNEEDRGEKTVRAVNKIEDEEIDKKVSVKPSKSSRRERPRQQIEQ